VSYKIQTNKLKAFLIQDFIPIIVVLVGIACSVLMVFVNINNIGESCGINAGDICNPSKGYIIFIPVAVFLLIVLFVMLINLIRIGTINKINLQYRNFSGITNSTENDYSNSATNNIAEYTKNEPKDNSVQSVKIKFYYGVFDWIKKIVLMQLIAAIILSLLNISTSSISTIEILVIPLITTVLNISYLKIKTEYTSAKLFVFLWKNPINDGEYAVDNYTYQRMLAQKRLMIIGLMFLFWFTGAIISIASVVISKIIYG
jgi:hypothetical protein